MIFSNNKYRIISWISFSLIIINILFDLWYLYFDFKSFSIDLWLSVCVLRPSIILEWIVYILGLLLIIKNNKYYGLLLGINSFSWIYTSVGMLNSIFTTRQFASLVPMLFINSIFILLLGIISLLSLIFFIKLHFFNKNL